MFVQDQVVVLREDIQRILNEQYFLSYPVIQSASHPGFFHSDEDGNHHLLERTLYVLMCKSTLSSKHAQSGRTIDQVNRLLVDYEFSRAWIDVQRLTVVRRT